MPGLPSLLKALAPICVIAGALHALLGLNADVLLGAHLAPELIANPSLDSQNRFYGVAFTVYGWLLYLCSTDLDRYRPVLHCMLAVFFAAGAARIVSILAQGWPSPSIIGLGAAELVLPLILAVWDVQSRRTAHAPKPSTP
jgi:hypothetical protein